MIKPLGRLTVMSEMLKSSQFLVHERVLIGLLVLMLKEGTAQGVQTPEASDGL